MLDQGEGGVNYFTRNQSNGPETIELVIEIGLMMKAKHPVVPKHHVV